MTDATTFKQVDELTFEAAFAELNIVLEKLEAGDLPLNDSLKLYEYGMSLAQRCNVQLDEAELTLQKLAPTDA